MTTRHAIFLWSLASLLAGAAPQTSRAQCCLNDLFAGCSSCFRKAPAAYAVMPVAAPMAAPVMAPVMAPIPAPPPPVMVPVQQVSYVPETTYRTQYECVPVTSYKPSCEIDPCTGCQRECMEQVTNYVQKAVNVPYTQYRAVYSTKYVQMQPGQNQQGYTQPAYGAQPTYGQPAPGYGQPAPQAPAAITSGPMPGPSGTVSSPFASPIQTSPQAWGAAANDIPQQVLPGQSSIAAPSLPQGAQPQSGFQQQIVPQGGTFAAPAPQAGPLQPTAPPTLSPTPSLKPIPELPRMPANQGAQAPAGTAGQAGTFGTAQGPGAIAPPAASTAPAGSFPAPSPLAPTFTQPGNVLPGLAPASPPAAPAPKAESGSAGIPTVPGAGPGAATGAFPRLLEPTSHTTSWQPASLWQPASYRPAYPTAALPSRQQ